MVVWYSHLLKNFPQFVVIHTVKSFSVFNEAEVDIFPECPCFLQDPANVDNLISGSSAFSKSRLYIWMLSVHIPQKPILKNFEHSLVSMCNECDFFFFFCSLEILWHCPSLGLDIFQSCGLCWVFQICWHIECSTFTASSFRIWNSSAEIPSPPIASLLAPDVNTSSLK